MSNKNRRSAERGTWALCITVGLIVGLGLGPMLGNVLISIIVGGILGAGAGYYFTHRKKRTKR